MVVTPLDFVTPSVYSSPPPWVPSFVVENLNGWEAEWLNVYVVPVLSIKDFFYKDILLFFTDYYMQFSKRLSKDDKKIIENRTFIVKSINDFFLYNLSQNTLLNSIENKLSNE